MTHGFDFRDVACGDYVLIEDDATLDPYIGVVLYCVGSARSFSACTLFQVSNIDTGEIKTINADCVKATVKPSAFEDKTVMSNDDSI
ncbi:DUF3104 domain-containing protein [Prochlorococcus sp. MIT 0601]|uniref:DUF3104 domain-containing protein n=1 Tax=Prochlorococcus sp. MIT 0601 TaxID=1499498 RepID=UPI000907ADAB|nr:DUF3104 domain-containing protein [Prochlorococcus sp. MIT 0601]